MKFTVKLPKILCLVMLMYKHIKNKKYYNTNDLVKLANELKPELVRTRNDKDDYKFLEDTNFGGLRGNFSTLLTFEGIIKKNNTFTPYYGLSHTDRLYNAIQKGEIILDTKNICAYTMNETLKFLLENEIKNFTIRENQAHIKQYLEKNDNFPLQRDYENFPKKAVLKSADNIYCMRILFNTFKNNNIVEFNMYDYLKGTKIKVFNMHPLFIIPSYENPWENFYLIDSKEILKNTPLFLYYDKTKQEFSDSSGNIYRHYSLEEGLTKLSDFNGNVDNRFSYQWNSVREKLANNIVVTQEGIMQSEFSVFLENFLQWEKQFSLFGKKVVDIKESSSGGADVILKFAGGTTQKLELEHKWNNYITHGHYKNAAWKNCWLYANEPWDFIKIKKIFQPYLHLYSECIPKIFLCINPSTKNKEGYEVDWNKLTYNKVLVQDSDN